MQQRLTEIQAQIKKYRGAVTNVLKEHRKDGEPIEIVCVLGRRPTNWKSYPTAEQESREALEKFHARIVTYGELIENAEKAYGDYTKQKKNITQLHRLIQEILPDDVAAMSRPSDADEHP